VIVDYVNGIPPAAVNPNVQSEWSNFEAMRGITLDLVGDSVDQEKGKKKKEVVFSTRQVASI
jgi:hypothetical protein